MRTKKLVIFIASILITATLIMTNANAQETSSPSKPSKDENLISPDNTINILQPADTSSPRDTLHGFLKEFNFVIDEQKRLGTEMSPSIFQAYERAVSMLDYSTTPDGGSRYIISLRMILLYEILARIVLPPKFEIPGDGEIETSGLTHWTIPGTRITIQQVEKGPRKGEFLFSAWTVQRLHRFYNLVQHLPYKSGFKTGLYKGYFTSIRSPANLEATLRNRLKPIDTTSPRSTLDGFFNSVNRAYDLVMKTEAALKSNPPTITIDEARNIELTALNLMKRARNTLDLSKVPQAVREHVGMESVLQLKEIFDRMNIPLIDTIPDTEMVEAERQRLSKTALGDTRPVRWRYPNTTIDIIEIMEGEQQGRYLFSANTVDRLSEYYKKVRDLPYRKDYGQVALEYNTGLSKGFYEYYISSPGQLITQVSFLGQLVDRLPGWFKKVHEGQTVWQWIGLTLTVCLGAVFLILLHGPFLRRPVELTKANRNWRRCFFNLIVIGSLYLIYLFLAHKINLTGSVLIVVTNCLTLAYWYFLATGVLYLSNAISETIVASPKIDPEGIQASYTRAIFGLFGLVAMVLLMLTGLFKVGVSLGPLLAGAGIGGLAIALAARPTIENVIGSFMIFMDKPFRVGQRVNVMGQNGTIESIGLRSTKIRLLTGHLTSIPNQQMANVEVENIGRRPYIRRLLNISITYDTPPEKINQAVDILKEILSLPDTTESESTESSGGIENITEMDYRNYPHPNEAINQPDFPPRVYFNDLNADSLNILVIYWYHPPEYWEYLEHAHWVNVQIMERFNAEGIDFAFPTQTLHLAGDEKRPLEVDKQQIFADNTNFENTISKNGGFKV